MNQLLVGIPEYAEADSIGQEWVEISELFSKKIGGVTAWIIGAFLIFSVDPPMPKETFFVLPCDRLLLVVEFGEEQIHYIEIPKGEWKLKKTSFSKDELCLIQ